MVYKLEEADKLCGVEYIDWTKKYSAIPKATCETISPKCDSISIVMDCGKPKPEEEKPKEEEDTGETTEQEFSLVEVMPRVEAKFSTVTHNNGLVTSITENSQEQKEAFERDIIETLKSKVPKGSVVEAVLGEPFYEKGSELITGRGNYSLNVRVTVKGKVYEHVYNVPNNLEEDKPIPTVSNNDLSELVDVPESDSTSITPEDGL